MPMTSIRHTISVGVIGTGLMGQVHARNLYSKVVGAKLVAVMDMDFARAEEVAAQCGDPQVFRDAHELIQSESVEAIVIASPDVTHAGLVLECLRLKKPVLCEKPLATKLDDAQKIIDAEMGLGRKLVQVGFVRRFDDQHLGVKRTIESGAIGCPMLFKGWHRGVGVPTANDVTLIGSAIHDLDSARWLLGQEIEEVFVRGRKTDHPVSQETSDLLLLQLSLSGNCLATIEHWQTKTTYAYEVGVEVVGELGTAFIGPPHGPVVRSNLTHAMQVESDWRERLAIGYISELESWIVSINSDNYVGPDAWDGYISLAAAEGCVIALQSGTPYRIPPAIRPSLYGDDKNPSPERTKGHAT